MPSAKDINIWKVNDYGMLKKPSKISTKEWQQSKMLQADNNLTNAKTFKFNREEREAAESFNADQAKLSRDWQKMMSDTAHTREVKDLKKAGLNPVLSANTGAQSYTTNAASIAGASGHADSAASAIASYGGAYLGSQATKYSANQSASAMRYSANMQYKSAQASAYAMMYSADRAAEASQYSADAAERAAKYGIDNSKSGSLWGVVDSWINKGFTGQGLPGAVVSNVKDIIGDFSIDDLKKNTNKPLSITNISQRGILKMAACAMKLSPYLPTNMSAYSAYKKAKLMLKIFGFTNDSYGESRTHGGSSGKW